MSTLFVLKNVPCVFFKNAEKYGQNCVKVQPTPSHSLSLCPSPNNVPGFRSLRANTLCVSFMLLEGGGGGGGGGGWGGCEKGVGSGLSRTCLKPCFPACGKKCRDVFSQKRSRHAKFQWILSNLENPTKSSYRAGLHGALQLFLECGRVYVLLSQLPKPENVSTVHYIMSM